MYFLHKISYCLKKKKHLVAVTPVVKLSDVLLSSHRFNKNKKKQANQLQGTIDMIKRRCTKLTKCIFDENVENGM